MPRRNIVVAALLAVVVAVVLAGCGSNGGSGDAGPTGGSVSQPAPASCGPVPTSSGPVAALASLRLSAPASAQSGSDLPVRVSVAVTADGGRIITVAPRSQLLVTRQGRVVARAAGGQSSLAVPLQLSAGAVRPAQVVPSSVKLVGCASGDAARGAPLPPGEYSIVAVLGYGVDPMNAQPDGSSGTFALVSAPTPITLT